jgi:hypothetical protein
MIASVPTPVDRAGYLGFGAGVEAGVRCWASDNVGIDATFGATFSTGGTKTDETFFRGTSLVVLSLEPTVGVVAAF